MSTYQQDSFLSEILVGEKIPLGKLAYFRERLRNRLYDLVLTEFLEQEKTRNLTRADVARRIGRRPEQITRWFGAPGNWTIDTVSDLMLAMGAEPALDVTTFAEQATTHNAKPQDELIQKPEQAEIFLKQLRLSQGSPVENVKEIFSGPRQKQEPHQQQTLQSTSSFQDQQADLSQQLLGQKAA